MQCILEALGWYIDHLGKSLSTVLASDRFVASLGCVAVRVGKRCRMPLIHPAEVGMPHFRRPMLDVCVKGEHVSHDPSMRVFDLLYAGLEEGGGY